ncbi:hypothetical protein C5167_007697 [Papaver somniferum]|nr:hypothetical protein C5167_007697 [Papaver somniferum]
MLYESLDEPFGGNGSWLRKMLLIGLRRKYGVALAVLELKEAKKEGLVAEAARGIACMDEHVQKDGKINPSELRNILKSNFMGAGNCQARRPETPNSGYRTPSVTATRNRQVCRLEKQIR